MAKISKELRETIESHPNINEVHFNVNGGHHFNVYPHGGEKYGRIIETVIKDPKTEKPKKVYAPKLETRIVETVTREEILNSESDEVGGKKEKATKKAGK